MITTARLRPIPDSYWVEPAQFLAGEYPGGWYTELTRQRLNVLLDDNFNAFIDLTSEGEQLPYDAILREQAVLYNTEVSYQRFAISDYGVPAPERMTAILDAIDAALAAQRKLYVHCWGGVGRTGTVVGCYLVRHGRSGVEALAQVMEWWQAVPKSTIHPLSPETERQRQFVRDWHE
jgi:hypothetical protein